MKCKLFLITVFLWAQPVLAFGPLGHEVIAGLAENWLQPEARTMLTELLPNETLAEASTWADRMRGHPSTFWQETASPYHYVTLPRGDYQLEKAPDKGDAVTALHEFRRVLEDAKRSRARRQLALRFSIHIVGDLHNPVHVGNGRDRGGNQVEIRFMGKHSNLHRLWDSGLLYQRGWSKQQWLQHLAQGITRAQRRAWSSVDPITWVHESRDLRPLVYSHTRTISKAYVDKAVPVLDQRLRQAGVRTADYLNLLARHYSPHR
ncbi:MAG: S1/P1 nuclease [Halieaceae bacterium]|nr:S1/P1 nuclease [Halieaceae bacterium]